MNVAQHYDVMSIEKLSWHNLVLNDIAHVSEKAMHAAMEQRNLGVKGPLDFLGELLDVKVVRHLIKHAHVVKKDVAHPIRPPFF